ncbi:MAG: GNAT family N-acetyltransferase [Bryobacterales bacterium]|nr:GNAT family N-acetyltransferase [Bryobacterales bacterium]
MAQPNGFRIVTVGVPSTDEKEHRAPDEVGVVRDLFREYQKWLMVDLCFQGFEKELAALPGAYAPPNGRLLLAYDDSGAVAGCVGLRPFDKERGEVKRLWVRDPFKGQGLGRVLLNRLMDEARTIGYQHLLLDTLPRMEAALRLYESCGFRETWPYTHNPEPGVLFLSKELG